MKHKHVAPVLLATSLSSSGRTLDNDGGQQADRDQPSCIRIHPRDMLVKRVDDCRSTVSELHVE